jgi:vacuolar protein sorting-associated protein 54
VHERLGKLVTVRSRPGALVLVTPAELARVGALVGLLAAETEAVCGRPSAGLHLSHQGQVLLYLQTIHEEQRQSVLGRLESERWRRGGAAREELEALHPVLGSALGVPGLDWGREAGLVEELPVAGELHTFADAVLPLLGALSAYLALADKLPNARVEVGLKAAELLKLFNSRTCQLVLGAGAVNMAGLKTITIRNLAVTLRSLGLVSGVIPEVTLGTAASAITAASPAHCTALHCTAVRDERCLQIRQHLLSSPGLSEKQEVTLAR